MTDPKHEKAVINISEAGDNISINIIAKKLDVVARNLTEEAQKALRLLFDSANITRVYYVDDIFEFVDDRAAFIGKIDALLAMGKGEDLQKRFTDFDFDAPVEVWTSVIEENWYDVKKRGNYWTLLFQISGEDKAFKMDLKAKNKIVEYIPKDVEAVYMAPSQWEKERQEILAGLPGDSKALFLFDNVFTHSPAPLNEKQGLDFISEIVDSEYVPSIVCGLITHTISVDEEVSKRKIICDERKIPFEHFFLLSKVRTERALQFADGVKKALLTSSCEIIKKRTIEIISQAQDATKKRLDILDAYAFDHIVIDSSFKEGVWEPETLLRINDFLFGDYVREEILKDPTYKDSINAELEIARAIGRIKVTDVSYDDHLSLRRQELYLSAKPLNAFNSPIENGDIFSIGSGKKAKKYVLVSQQCDLAIRSDGHRKSRYGTLLEISESSESSLKSTIESYNRKDPFRQHYFADKFKMTYFDEMANKDLKIGVVDFGKSVLLDIDVLDLAAFNTDGNCKIDLINPPAITTQLPSSWRNRLEVVLHKFRTLSADLDSLKPIIDTLTPEETQKQIWHTLMPTVSFIDKIGHDPSYSDGVFNFGIQRIKRYREPKATLLLNKYTRYLSREAEDHDFANK